MANLFDDNEQKPRGKTKSSASDYQQKCNAKLNVLIEKMNAIGDKKNAEW